MAESCNGTHMIDAGERARAKKSKSGATVKCKRCGKRLRLKPSGESIKDEAKVQEAKLSAADRKALPKSAFVFPDKAPGSGSYPIHDESHARAALSMSAGKPEEAKVRAAVHRRYPNLGGKKD
jgi:hypothetical protein